MTDADDVFFRDVYKALNDSINNFEEYYLGAEDQLDQFEIHRDEDPTGVSGTGVVARGFVLPETGIVVIKWLTEHSSVAIWENMEEMSAVHLHHDLSHVVWTNRASKES